MTNLQQVVRPSRASREAGPRHTVGRTSRKRPANRSRTVGFLGVLVDALDFSARAGAAVVGSVAGSSAARVGLAAGDTITSVNGVGITTAKALGDALSMQRPGDHVTLTWVTPHKTAHVANVRLSRAPESKARIYRQERRLRRSAPRSGPESARSTMPPRGRRDLVTSDECLPRSA
jgi:hypothetical protein